VSRLPARVWWAGIRSYPLTWRAAWYRWRRDRTTLASMRHQARLYVLSDKADELLAILGPYDKPKDSR
jgi:hypothetical protein